jgi:autotransporter adhesin
MPGDTKDSARISRSPINFSVPHDQLGKLKRPRAALLLGCSMVALSVGLTLAPNHAHAVICANAGAGVDSGNDAGNPNNTACGKNAQAVGANSSAYGLNSTASGTASTAIGLGSQATSANTVAVGKASSATGASSVAIGDVSVASGARSTATGPLSAATGNNSSAYGDRSLASGLNSSAFGLGSKATGTNSAAYGVGSKAIGASSTAVGDDSNASGIQSVAYGADSSASGVNSVAVGFLSNATGPSAIAIGDRAQSLGAGTIAIGQGAVATDSVAVGKMATASLGGSAFGDFAMATGTNSVAVGLGAGATGATTTAVGTGAIAAPDNSAAIGAGATATRINQQVFGTASNTYTMPGITSGASKAAQGAPTHIVTTNPSGDLAAHTPAELGLAGNVEITNINNQITILKQNDKELMDGIAISLALAQPIFQPGQTFAMRAGWGNFDGANAVGITAAGLVGRGYWGPTSAIIVDAGIGTGTSEGVVGGRAGVTFGW